MAKGKNGGVEKASGKTEDKPIGVVTHYFPKVSVAVVKIKEPIGVGDRIAFRGATTDFAQTVASIEVDHQPVQKASKGKEVGIKVEKRVREDDGVFRA